MTRSPVPGAWTGAELERDGRWLRRFDDGHRAEIAAALAAGLPETGFGKADFPLDRTATLLTDVAAELAPGVVRGGTLQADGRRSPAVPAEARGVPVLA